MQNVKGGGMFARLGSLLRCGSAPSAGEIIAHIRRGASQRNAATPPPREAAEAIRHMIARCDRHHTHDRGPWRPPHCWEPRPPRPHPPDCRPQPVPLPFPGWGCHSRPPRLEPPRWIVPFPDPCPGKPLPLIPLASGRG
jgi:hypothetical protein